MTKKLGDITSIVNVDYLGNVADDLTTEQAVTDSVNYLSNFYRFKKLDSTKVTVADQAWVDKPVDYPTLKNRIRRVAVDGVEMKEARFNDLGDIEDKETERWYEDSDKIRFTEAPTEAGLTVDLWINQKFWPPTAGDETDVPDEIMELVYLGAAFRYWRRYLSDVVMNKSTYPDIDTDEARRVMEAYRADYNAMLKKFDKVFLID